MWQLLPLPVIHASPAIPSRRWCLFQPPLPLPKKSSSPPLYPLRKTGPLSPYFTLDNLSMPHCTILLPAKVKTVGKGARTAPSGEQLHEYSDAATRRHGRATPPPLLNCFHGSLPLARQLLLLIPRPPALLHRVLVGKTVEGDRAHRRKTITY